LEIQPLVFKLEFRHLLRALAKIEKEASMSGLSSAPKHTGQARRLVLPPISMVATSAMSRLSADADLMNERASTANFQPPTPKVSSFGRWELGVESWELTRSAFI
jgi:hypothetical protein